MIADKLQNNMMTILAKSLRIVVVLAIGKIDDILYFIVVLQFIDVL
jgi:hypothetical protein